MKTLLLSTIIVLLSLSAFGQQKFARQVVAPNLVEPLGSQFVVPISIDNGTGIISAQGEMYFNPAIAQPTGDNFGCTTAGTISENKLTVLCNVVTDARGTKLLMVLYGAYPLSGMGAMVNVNFTATGKGTTALHFENAFLHEGTPVSVWHDGFIAVW